VSSGSGGTLSNTHSDWRCRGTEASDGRSEEDPKVTVQVAPEVASKLAQLSKDRAALARVSVLLEQIRAASDRDVLLGVLGPSVGVLGDEVFVARLGNLRVFMSIGQSDVLIVDVAVVGGGPETRQPAAANDPKYNANRNPKFNAAINPTLNASLNPKFNSAINPLFNSTLNPRFNSTINPRFNSALNPRFNPAINPRFNSALNPKFNATINPRYNSTYPGPYVYGLDLDRQGYVVQASDKVDLIFDNDGEHVATAVHNPSEGRTLFDDSLEWVGYTVPDGKGGYLRFDRDGQWNGILV
jgi:hypothetical protein